MVFFFWCIYTIVSYQKKVYYELYVKFLAL